MDERHYQADDGIELCYADWGARSAPLTVLCLPGLTRNSRDFTALAARLASRYRVLAPDFRGRGRSARDPDWRNYHPRRYARDIRQLIDALRLERVALIGTSLGGVVSALLAQEGLPALRAVVLNDIGPEIDPQGRARIAGYVGTGRPMRDWADAVQAVRAINERALPDLDDAEWRAFTQGLCRETADGTVVFDYDPAIGQAYRAGAGGGIDLWPAFRALAGLPVALLRGEHSDILSRDAAARLRAQLPLLELVEIPRRGHTPLLNEPESVAAIEAVLAGAAGMAPGRA